MDAEVVSGIVNFAHTPLALLSSLHLLNIFWPRHADVKDNDCFDYIIIGSGAGGVLANRLTEVPTNNVLLIEAGHVPSIQSVLPGLFPVLQNSYEDFQFKSQAEVTTVSQSGNHFKLAAGKVLGGSSSINHLICLRNAGKHFDFWANFSDESWSYEDVLPYFKKIENLQDEEILDLDVTEKSNVTYHSTKGRLSVSRELHSEADDILKAFAELKKQIKIDLNRYNTVGYAQPTFSVANGLRQSVAVAYLSGLKSRSNLKILYNSIATKINFENKRAVSVKVKIGGKTITVKARKEIIVSAGVFGSPKLLMQSGIGPEDHLKSLGIEVIANLPVGENLQDHVAVQKVFKLEKTLPIPPLLIPTQVGLPVIIGADTLDPDRVYQTFQTTNLVLAPGAPFLLIICTEIFGYRKDLCQKLHDESIGAGRKALYSLVAKLQPESRGEVKLKSSSPDDDLTIKQNFYKNKSDLDDMVSYIKEFIKVLNTTHFKEVHSELVNVQFDNCTGNFEDDNYIRCYIKQMTTTLYHQTSTCSMGTVVDRNLKVKEIERLRIVDASIMPKIPSANPLADTLMIAEKAADMIKGDSTLEGMCKVEI